MAIEVELRGAAELRRAARDLREADRLLDRRIASGIRKVGAGFARDVRTGVPRYVPSGYAPVLSAALKVSTSFKRGGISFRVYAPGKSEERAVRAINDGVLRHPVFGHRDRWVAQRIKPGFVDDPRKALAERAYDEIVAAVDAAITVAKG